MIEKRQHAIKALCRGLDRLNLCKRLQEYPDLMKPAFLFEKQLPLTAETFIHLIATPKPLDEMKGRVYDWFIEHISGDSRETSLEQILLFCTGLRRVPPMGLRNRITIDFLSTSPLPMAEACFGIIRLPTVHTDKAMFFAKLDQGILYSLNHYGQV